MYQGFYKSQQQQAPLLQLWIEVVNMSPFNYQMSLSHLYDTLFLYALE